MNYRRIYTDLIAKAKAEGRAKGQTYYERHHIIPKCLGGNNDKDNLILLTPREHYVAHKLLTLIHPEHPGIALAFHIMTTDKRGDRRVTSRDYALAATLMAKAVSGKNNGAYGRTLTPEHKRKMTEGRLLMNKINSFFTPNVCIGRRKYTEEEKIKRRKESAKRFQEKEKARRNAMPKKKRTYSEEERREISERVKRAFQRPEVKAKIDAMIEFNRSEEGRELFRKKKRGRLKKD